ncbi:MAG TPA: NlpC/P60 family protein [Pirellulales bacterium]|jgi:cell wall-associated NlpC family hydrolase|nr:NlpC/P60 family protein [Pirellulales bacterium]
MMLPETTSTAGDTTLDPEKSWTRRRALKALSVWGGAPLLAGALEASGRQTAWGATDAAYRIEFSGSLADLVGDLEHTERGDPLRESNLHHSQWYSAHTRRRFHTWGPEPRQYAPLANLGHSPVEWQRERVIATAARFLGYGYQYHHIPDWDPPSSWPWKETCVGHNGKGVDCSNLTSFVFNQGFGIRISSAIHLQAERERALEAPFETIAIRSIALPKQYERRIETLQTGDLVYIRGREGGPISHVVIWVGSVGRAQSGVPLLIDSHGSGVVDDLGRPIPCGVRLRPFRQDSWYNRCASHAHRILGNSTQ